LPPGRAAAVEVGGAYQVPYKVGACVLINQLDSDPSPSKYSVTSSLIQVSN